MAAKPGQHQRNPKGKPKVGGANPAPAAPLTPAPPIPTSSPPPLFHTYDQPKPDGAYFSQEAADRAVEWIEEHCHHFQGVWAGHPMILYPWQRRFVEQLFGWLREDGTRLHRTAYLEVPRKAGKSTMAAAIGLYLAYGDGEAAPQVFFAAYDKEQAKVCYKAARIMVERDPRLGGQTLIYNSSSEMLLNDNPGGIIKVLSSDAAKQYGLNIHGLVFDELMTQRNREMWDALTTSMGARQQPLTLAITTAGFNRTSLCFELREFANRIAAGEEADPSFLGVVYSIDETADWRDPEAWRAANPSLDIGEGGTIGEPYYAQECAKAQSTPTYENAFRTLLLSQWVGQETRFIPMDKWDAIKSVPIFPKRAVAFGGLDLASTTDLAAFALVTRGDDDEVAVELHPFIPAEEMRERIMRDRVPYDVWVRDERVHATPGNVIDYAYIKQAIRQAKLDYDLKDISYDRWGAIQLAQEMEAEGITMVQMGQGFASMSAPTKELLRLVLEGKLIHGGNPVLRWNAENCAAKIDEAGNVKPDKARSAARIDGLVATIMALDGLMRRGQKRKSVYEARGLFQWETESGREEALA